MKVTVISIAVLASLFLTCQSSAEFLVEYPKIINLSEPFNIEIINSVSEYKDFDLKIYLEEEKADYSRVFDPNKEKWVSSKEFLLKVYPHYFSFKVKAFKSSVSKLCIKIRESESKIIVFSKCYDLEVKEEFRPLVNINKNQEDNIQTDRKTVYERPHLIDKSILVLSIVIILLLSLKLVT